MDGVKRNKICTLNLHLKGIERVYVDSERNGLSDVNSVLSL
jgi:hypothetical protein